ncbi:hypothetical protein [Uliginosibacterium sp. 31-12]|uniref:hypothetical protein n=1 Tax=Uliginosibacterium sp. 31-12 TaxID=3062781 RepID=UPI0026E1B34E|nr:hypothetical protein [Uliginosibacterium sp. 31-12]MDO6387912.1 hypothetical protein [Uliginosibacterium sp. 31-12]
MSETDVANRLDELAKRRPICFELGRVEVASDVRDHLRALGVQVESVLSWHQRLLPDANVMDSSDHAINLAAAPKKRMVLSVYALGEHRIGEGVRSLWVETADGHEHTVMRLLPPLPKASNEKWFQRVARLLR